MSDWKLAMLAILPLMLHRMAFTHRLRTWLALMGASLVAIVLPSIHAFIIINAVAGAIVIARPAGLAQKAIGLIFAGMVLFHAGFLFSSQAGFETYMWAQHFMGWAQLACLALWGAYDTWRPVFRIAGPVAGSPAHHGHS